MGARIGLVLGSGSARGLAHIGIIEALQARGIHPDIICGSSAGALVGATYVTGQLQPFREWLLTLSSADVLRYLNVRLTAGGGFAHATRLINHLRRECGDHRIENLGKPFAAVATNLHSGHEVWLREGDLWSAVRASFAIPGLLTPAQIGQQWLVDGGLVNPVPVSVCRALGADFIIAVNLNGDLIGRHLTSAANIIDPTPELMPEKTSNRFWGEWLSSKEQSPGLLSIMANSLSIMQDRITRSRLAGEPADILLSPRLSHIGLMEFTRGAEAIAEGHRCVERHQRELDYLLGKL